MSACIALFACEVKQEAPATGASDRLKRYFSSVPGNLVIRKYDESPSPAMDHCYLWKIAIADDEYWRRFEAQITDKPSNRDAMGVDTGLISDSYPRWWKKAGLEKLEGYRFIVSGNHHVYVMIDRAAGYLYVQVHT